MKTLRNQPETCDHPLMDWRLLFLAICIIIAIAQTITFLSAEPYLSIAEVVTVTAEPVGGAVTLFKN